MIMNGVTEYAEGMGVELTQTRGAYQNGVPDERREKRGNLVIKARNEGGYNCTEVDLLELIAWLKEHRPDLLA